MKSLAKIIVVLLNTKRSPEIHKRYSSNGKNVREQMQSPENAQQINKTIWNVLSQQKLWERLII